MPDVTFAYNSPNLYSHPSETTAQWRTKHPAAKCYGSPPQAITPLTEDWTLLRSQANNLTPTGYTNITVGLAWGWHVLSPTGLYTEGQPYGTDDLTKFIILMTDGDNTKNTWNNGSSCNSNCVDAINARTEAVCSNIKAVKKPDGTPAIEIFTIRLMDGNETLLKSCASKPDMYYNVQNAGALAGVFSAIGSKIASLHLAK